MNATPRVDNMAQFMQLVSAARARNTMTPASRATLAQRPLFDMAVPGTGSNDYRTSTQRVSNEITLLQKQNATRVLGTRFDSYA